MGGSESWTYGEKTHTSSYEAAVTEQMLSELTKHVEETKAGCDNVSDIKPQRSQNMNARFLLSTISCSITVTITYFSTPFVVLGS